MISNLSEMGRRGSLIATSHPESALPLGEIASRKGGVQSKRKGASAR